MLGGALAAATLVFGLGGSAAFVDVAGAVLATGAVSPQGRPKAVQHLDGGIVREIRVRNGSVVDKGDLLLRLDDTALRSAVEIHRNRLREGLARQARLQTERDGVAAIDWARATLPGLAEVGASADQRSAQQRLFNVRRAARGGQVSQRGEKVKQFQNQIAGTQGLIASKTEQAASIERELLGLRSLQKEGFVPATRILALEREQSALAGQVVEHRAELARIGNGIDETQIGVLQGEREFQENVLAELRQLTSEMADTSQQYRAAREQLSRVEIRAPESGVVHELNIVTVGGVVAPGATLMQLVSSAQGLVIDAGIEPQFIDQVLLGQTAVVRFPAFSRHSTPELTGTVATVSPTSVLDERSGAAFYRVEVQITAAELARLEPRALVPGMPVEVFVQTGERSILSYLVKPLRDQFQRALRER